ncbi:hypothetical protein BDV93DRAFT_594799 [Ceratobasidium sp. AG-I]|nr:hypothetical protein BDV93DRAFT_594799 [Ceratobasidium sp. AG-I]
MSITFDESALQTIMALPVPYVAVNGAAEYISTISNEMNTLAEMGRGILRSCVTARTFQSPVPDNFDIQVESAISEARLAHIATTSGLLGRLSLDGVATNVPTTAIIICAYIGASFKNYIQGDDVGTMHDSINAICSMVLEDEPIGGGQ